MVVMGVHTPRCGKCGCGHCPQGGKDFTLKEEREFKLMEDGLKFENSYFTAVYPWIKDPNKLPDNKVAVHAMLKSTERRLMKDKSKAMVYQQQIEDMVIRGAARKLSTAELKQYRCPVYYVSHHEVLKHSETTPCRIVFNSSARFGQHILNEYWAKGPDIINNLQGILLRFREEWVAIIRDLQKMYHSVKISLLDQHVHHFFMERS